MVLVIVLGRVLYEVVVYLFVCDCDGDGCCVLGWLGCVFWYCFVV